MDFLSQLLFLNSALSFAINLDGVSALGPPTLALAVINASLDSVT
jgi:hypothetical protein